MKKNINDDNNGKIKKQSYSRLWFKKALKNIAVGAISVGVVAGAIFGFAGCGNTNTPTPTPPDIDPNPPIITPQPGDEEIKNVDFSEFLSTPAYKQEGINFFNEVIKPQITSGKGEVLAETINFDSTDESSLDNVSYAYVYKTGETSRKYDVVNVQFSPIKFDDILNDKVNNNNVVPIIQTTLSFDFDAKENVNKSDLMDAVYSRMRHYSSSLDSDATTYFGDVSSR